MNILLIHQFYLEDDDPGGSRFNEMTKVWVAEGHHVTVVCGMLNYVTGQVHKKYRGKVFHKQSYENLIDVIRCFVSPQYNKSFLGRFWSYFSFMFFGILGVFVFLRTRKIDVILSSSPPLFVGIIAWVASKVKNAPYVFEIRDLWPESAIDTGVLSNKLLIRISFFAEKFIYRGASLISVLTPSFRDFLKERKNIKEQKIILIPNACDFSFSDQLLNTFDRDNFRKKRGWEGQFVVVYVGAHGLANHLIQLLDAASELRELPIKFVLIGDGMQKEMLIKQAIDRNLTQIEFINPVPKQEVIKYVIAADAGISVLKKLETFKTIYSNKTFDYMSCKRPILMLIDGISRKLVEEAGCGLYAEPENIAQITTKVKILFNDPSLCTIMGIKGYDFAKVNFDRKLLAEKYLFELKGVIYNV